MTLLYFVFLDVFFNNRQLRETSGKILVFEIIAIKTEKKNQILTKIQLIWICIFLMF